MRKFLASYWYYLKVSAKTVYLYLFLLPAVFLGRPTLASKVINVIVVVAIVPLLVMLESRSQGTRPTVMSCRIPYPPEFIARVKNEFPYYLPLWRALDDSDEKTVDRYLEIACRSDVLDVTEVIEMVREGRSDEALKKAEALHERNVSREKLYDDWCEIINQETQAQRIEKLTGSWPRQ